MSYTLTIGKARYIDNDAELEEHGGYRWTVDKCDGPSPHTDEWEASPNEGSPVRLPGYSQWHEVLETLPRFKLLWHSLQEWSQHEKRNVIPVTQYVRSLPAILSEASCAPVESAARAQWFARWSLHALDLYGEAAAFDTPSEWVTWEPDVILVEA